MRLTSILVDVDAAAVSHPALEEAVPLAARCGARLVIVDVLPHVPSGARAFLTGRLEDRIVAERRTRLDTLARSVPHTGVSARLLRGRPATALIREVLTGRHDLLVRSHGRDLAARSRPFGAVDMELLRQCPCPVWLVVGRAASPPRHLLAAVHAVPDDGPEQRLNEAILDAAAAVAEIQGAGLTVLQAWSVFGETLLSSHMPANELATLIEETRRTAEAALTALVTGAGPRLARASVELRKGEAEDVIPAVVESRGVDLIVMGTVARTGVAGRLIGNTAERVVQRVRCSVLALKPPGFESPVRAEEGAGGEAG